jgi:two-component system, chemotaxis family, sensor kinase CheA
VSVDPYKYFRVEARELIDGLSAGVLQIERGGPNKEVVGRLLRLAHTLKGAARVVRLTEIARHSHAVEDALAPFRDGHGSLPAERVTQLLGLIDQMASELASLDGPKASAVPAPRANAEVPVETVRVELEEMDLLLDGVTEATVQINSLEREGERLARARDLTKLLLEQLGAGQAEKGNSPAATLRAYALAEELGYTLERVSRNVASGVELVNRELGQVRDAANRFRLQPASAIFSSLERAVRDAAQALGKRIAFRTTGGDGRVDAHVLSGMRDALSHVVRNAVAHGIEPESQRVASRKPPVGEVTLAVERRGDRIAFSCRDDGRGIDVAGLRRAAVVAGAVGEAESTRLSDADVFQLLLQGGLTTARALTEVSGRAVGLDAVRETVSRFNGQVRIRTEPGRGTSVEILVPVSLSSVSSLVVEADGVAAAVPLDAVRRTLRVTDAEIARTADGDSIVHEGRVIPFIPLARALRRPGASTRRRLAWSAVVVAAGSSLAAVGVDRLLGTGTVVVRPLPARADIDGVVAGASLDAEGHPQLVVDPEGLVAAAQQARALVSEAQVRPRLPLLVVDDSLTTRMLEQSILESAGYEVDLATSAEQALEKAKSQRYALFVVDVEMPGMDGFQFVATTRADPNLRETPAILVTSRGAPEDQRRGLEAGARAYIAKGEFDQGHLLKSIRDLIG